ncbi:MAG TPA: hypothetical protein PKY12_08860, partial [Catalimonadaceae bacterium]|nr:hypothetical protein [Catalimonadaceae bacterium]
KKFLKQRKGCKRDDSPDFRFKHLLYTYYSHRDGAARFHYNQDDTFLDFDSTLSAEIEEKRQLYKINTYLHDVPPESTDPKLFPIYNANGRNLESLDELMEFAAESGAFSKLSIRRIEIETKAGIKVPEHSVYVSHKDTPNIQVQIHRETLHRILIEALKGNGDEMQRSVLRFSLERLHIHRLLEDCKLLNAFLTHRREKLARWLNEYSNFRLRNFDGLLRREFAKWMESILAGKATEIRKLKDLIVKHPPEMRYLDFYFTHNRKVRQQNEFMRFSVRYMVDRRVVPSICWQWQAFETFINKEGKSVLAEITCFQPTKPEKKTNLSCNWRLKFTHDEQILFTWNQPTEPQAANEKRQDRPKVQPLLMGHRAMKNLLTAHLVDNKDLNPFFETLSNEIRGLKEGTMDQYILLDESSIPVSLMPLKRKSLEQTLKTRVGKRLESLINQLAEDLVDPPQKRAEKNRKIMQSYLLFDWPKRPDGSSEHLRKSENNLMSIYHYTMEKHRLPNLLQEIENGRRDRIPVEVRQLLSESKSLDELFVNSLRLACDWLANRKAALSIIKGKDLKELARKISVPVYEPIEEKTKNPNTPFDIHPILILKSLYPDEYKTGGFSLSAKVWSDKKLPLIDRFYYSGQALNNLPKGKSRIQIGALNELRAQDGLLFKIGQKYEAHYNQVEDMHNSILPMVAVPDLKIKTPIFDFQPFGSPKIRARVMVKFHQLDDHMVLLAAHQVQKLIWHFLTMKQGMDANGKVKVAKDKDLIKSGVSIKRSGDQILYEIPLEGLRRAMEYV